MAYHRDYTGSSLGLFVNDLDDGKECAYIKIN